ncbi:hypothetical protein HIM_08736 [Hirsutella minnesotensis 3608]|uniref:Spo12-like protein n=1 Tax=Hirsutella minnesotensis 3608 TaxID=1043627 RepID=A0A0F7ZH23_9HYPO|nr:hypothetical protein HIM_08736 [Hirsutella minnesotensis 3608]
MPANVLASKDVNVPMADPQVAAGKDVKSMEYHRQVFQSKMAEEKYEPPAHSSSSGLVGVVLNERVRACRSKQYVSPSDNIMSPCSAKITALRSKHVAKMKPKSLFAQASAKKLNGENALGARPAQP